MKKIILGAILCLFMSSPFTLVAGGGDSFAGGLAGGMVGGLVSGAMTKDRSGRRAEDKVGQLQREQDQEKVEQLRRKQDQEKYAQLKQELSKSKRDANYNMLLIIMAIMFFSIIALGVMVIKMKKR